MSLEGRLRDLRPLELCQLLSSSRKTGVLLVRAPLHARALELRLLHGAVTSSSQWPLSRSATGAIEPGAQSDATSAQSIADAVLDLLTWREGDFRFVAAMPADSPPSQLRVALEPLFVEALQRADVWERLADRLTNARAVPAFVDVDPRQLPLLRLDPQEWETLTRVDGRRDITALAEALGRGVLDIAEIVHRLIGAGLLQIREPAREPRRHPTPPAHAMPVDSLQIGDLWIPENRHGPSDEAPNDEDLIFDPVTSEVTSAERVRRQVTPVTDRVPRGGQPPASSVADATWHEVSHAWRSAEISVASPAGDPSNDADDRARWAEEAASLAMRGDQAALRGDLPEALIHWSAALRSEELPADADRIREAVALAARLHALLHPHRPMMVPNVSTRAG